MARSIRTALALASEKDVTSIMKIDAQKVSTQVDAYCTDNLLGYYTLINVWLMLIREWSTYGWTYVLDLIRRVGLFEVIRLFDTAAAEIVHGSDVTFATARMIYADVRRSVGKFTNPVDAERSFAFDPMAVMLLLCRFPKRFSPLRADVLTEASLQSFYDTQKRLWALQRQNPPRFIIERVRDEAYHLLKWDDLVRELSRVSIDDIIFTPGVSFDTDATLVSKLQSLAGQKAEFFYQPFGIPLVSHQGCSDPIFWGKFNNYEQHLIRLIAVPKNYKTARVIAPENVYRQALARRYFMISDRYLPGEIKLHDQTQNQDYALRGSLNGEFATIDLSAASDSMTPTLLGSILPPAFMKIMGDVLPTHYEWKKKVWQLQSAATMGNSMTFWLESVVFASVARAAMREVEILTNTPLADYSVYGDDIIVPTEAAQTCMEWLEALGFIVNTDKSFADDHLYRESCGEEYYRGVNVSSRYFPRFPLEGTLGGKFSTKVRRDGYLGTSIDTMTSMLDLQHKMFLICEPAARFLFEIIMEAEPRMTTSTPDMGMSDLYSYESLGREIPAPAASGITNGKWDVITVEGQVRDGHLGPITTYPKAKEDVFKEILFDTYKYQEFLKHGPRFDSPLDELLGVSAAPMTFDEASGKSIIKWAYIK